MPHIPPFQEDHINLLERLQPPEDVYEQYPGQNLPPSPPPASPPWQPPVRVELELVYPPRPPVIGVDENGENITQPISADWLRTMFDEQEAYHRTICNRLLEAQTAAREAAADALQLQAELEEQQGEFQGLMDAVRLMVGKEKFKEFSRILTFATEEGRMPVPEEMSDDDEDEDEDMALDQNEEWQGDETQIIDDDDDDDDEESEETQQTNTVDENSAGPSSRKAQSNNGAAQPHQESQPSSSGINAKGKGKEKATDQNTPTTPVAAPRDGFFARLRDSLFAPRPNLKRSRDDSEDEDVEPEETQSNTKELRQLQKEASIESVEFISSNFDPLDRQPPRKKRKTVSRSAMYTRASSPLTNTDTHENKSSIALAGPSNPTPNAPSTTANVNVLSISAAPSSPCAEQCVPSDLPPASPQAGPSTLKKTPLTSGADKAASQSAGLGRLSNMPRPPPTVRATVIWGNYRPLERSKERVVLDKTTGEPRLIHDYTKTPEYFDQLRTDKFNELLMKERQEEATRYQAAVDAGQKETYLPTLPMDAGRMKMVSDISILRYDGLGPKFKFALPVPGDIVFDHNY